MRLDSACEVIMGQAPSGASYNYEEEGLPLIAGFGDIVSGQFHIKKWTSQPTKICQVGDLIIGVRATLGANILADRNYCLGRGVAALRPNCGVDIFFLRHWMNENKRHLLRLAKGSTFLQVTKEDISQLEINLPSLEEQKRIAAILDQAEELKQKRQHALDLLEELKHSTFIDMFGDPILNNKGWHLEKLVNLTSKIGSGATPRGGEKAYKESGIALIRSMNVRDGLFKEKGLAYIDDKQADALKNVQVKASDILLNITGASVARVCRAPDKYNGARVNQHVAIIRPVGHLKNLFLEYQLLNSSFKAKLLAGAGAGATREAITKTDIEKTEIILPPIELQDQFEDKIQQISNLEIQNWQSQEKINELFISLQHKAFSGELSGAA